MRIKNLRRLNDHEQSVVREALERMAEGTDKARWGAQSMLEQNMVASFFWAQEEEDK